MINIPKDIRSWKENTCIDITSIPRIEGNATLYTVILSIILRNVINSN